MVAVCLLADVTISSSMLEWALGLLVVQLIAAAAWGVRLQIAVNNLRQEVRSIRDWQAERQKPIEEYYHRQEALSSRLVAVEEQSRNNSKTLERIEAKLDRLI